MAATKIVGSVLFSKILVFIFLLFLKETPYINAFTHWVVTEEGKIQAQVNSIFHMKRPYDLVALIEQESRVSLLEGLKDEMSDQKLDAVERRHNEIDFAHGSTEDGMTVEKQFFHKDPDCIAAGKPLAEFDLFVSTLIQPDKSMLSGIDPAILKDEYGEYNGRYEEPYCSKVKTLEKFYIGDVDELKVLQKPHQLKMGGELGLMSAVLEDGRFHLRQYGHLVSKALKANNKGNICMACLFASNFWRIVGRPAEAIECQKKALHLAPKIWKFSALLSMANVLHRTHHSEDAVTVLYKAIEITPDNPALHFTLGNIQATLLNFNKSAESFSMALKLQPHFEAAKRRRHAVVCHQRIEQALEEQQHALQETLKELRHYKKQHDKWSQILNKIINEQASLETRMQTINGYEHSKMRLQMAESETRRRSKLYQSRRSNDKWKPKKHPGNCAQTIDEDGNIYLTCTVLPSDGSEVEQQLSTFDDPPNLEDVTNEFPRHFDNKRNDNYLDTNDVDLLLRKFESRMKGINGESETISSNSNLDFEEDTFPSTGTGMKSKSGSEKSLNDDFDIRPTLPEMYSKYPDETDSHYNKNSKKVSWSHLKQIFGQDWPTKEICNLHNLKREWNEYPTVFLSPENKGFDVRQMLSDGLGMQPERPATLPWYPPFCKAFKGHIEKYDKLQSLRKWQMIGVKHPEKSIEEAYTIHSPEKNLQEWGARVSQAMKKGLSPRWIVYLLAGTYWRIWGHPQNAVHCYRHSLARVPPEYKYVVLTNLAGLLFSTETIDDALSVMQDSINLEPKDPDSNFFIANLYVIKGNLTGAIHHYQNALRMKPDYELAKQYVHVPACLQKFPPPPPPPTQSPSTQNQKSNTLESPENQFSREETCEQRMSRKQNHDLGIKRVAKARELGLSEDSVTFLDEEDEGGANMIVCSNGNCKFLNTHLVLGVTNRCYGDGEHTEEKRCVVRPREQLECKNNVNQDKTSNKKKTNKNKKKEREQTNEITETTKSNVDNEADLHFEENSKTLKTEDISDSVLLTKNEATPQLENIFGPIHLIDDDLPDMLFKDRVKSMKRKAPTLRQCRHSKKINWTVFTSTWLSVSAKNIDIRKSLTEDNIFITGGASSDAYHRDLDEGENEMEEESYVDDSIQPYCDEVPTSLRIPDHLEGVKRRRYLHLAAESGLKEALQGLGGEDPTETSVEEMAFRISRAMGRNSTSWVLSSAAALYWRVKGNAEQAVICLRHSLYYSPYSMKDIPLVSLANILHRAGLYNDALIVANQALEISQSFVVIHFTIANIYVSKGEFSTAISYYESTLELQPTFDPARDRLLSLQCNKNRLS